jgi:hypothetical protein
VMAERSALPEFSACLLRARFATVLPTRGD